MRRYLKNLIKNTQLQLICIVVFLLFIPIILLFRLGFDKSEKILMEKTAYLIEQNLKQTQKSLNDMFFETQKLSSIASTDPFIMNTLKEHYENPNPMGSDVYSYTLEMWTNVVKIQTILSSYRNSFFDYRVHSLVIATDYTTFSVIDGIGDSIQFTSNFQKTLHEQAWYQNFLARDNISFWYMPLYYDDSGQIFPNNMEMSKVQKYIVFARKLVDYTSQNEQGVSIISLPCSNFDQIFKADKGNIMAIVNMNGELVYSTTSPSEDFSITLDDIKDLNQSNSDFFYKEVDSINYMVNYIYLDVVNGFLLYMLPQDNITVDITNLRNYTLVTYTIIACMLLFVVINLILQVTRPITRMIHRVKAIKIGNQEVDQGQQIPKDLVSLERTLDQMVARIEELIAATLQEQQLHSRLQYDALCAQIQPHFLFNTLNSIKWTAMLSGANNIADMITNLGQLLEATLIRGEKVITIKRELELISNYAQIKNSTLKYKFELKFDIENSLEKCKLIKFSLQPIVENAIIHGIANNSDGKITVVARRDKNDILIQVIDNGKGMNPEIISKIFLNDENIYDQSQRFSGIGLYSIHMLTQITYGIKYGLNINSKIGDGTTVTLRLPNITDNDKEDVDYA